MGQLSENYGMPTVFDEASMSGIKDFTNMLYMLAEGNEKARMTKELTLRERANWRTTILSTGEHGLLSKSKRNAGLRVRILELADVAWSKSANNSETIKEVVLANYGHAAPLLAQYLLELGKAEVISQVEKWRELVLLELNDADRFVERASLKLAIISATASFVKEHFDLDLDIQALLSFLLQHEMQSMEDRDLGAKAFTYFLEQVSVHHHRFSSNYGELSKGIADFEYTQGEHWGRLDRSGSSAEISITKTAFANIMQEGGFEEPRTILSKWKQDGLLNCEADRLTRRRKLSPTSPVLDLYVIKVDSSLLQDTADKKATRSSRLPNGKFPLKVVGS